jgi:hypothetical protein
MNMRSQTFKDMFINKNIKSSILRILNMSYSSILKISIFIEFNMLIRNIYSFGSYRYIRFMFFKK